MGKLVRNMATCNNCGTLIESRHRHDLVSCECGNLFVDGGLDYTRRGYMDDNWTEQSVYEE